MLITHTHFRCTSYILGTSTELLKVTVNFIVSVCPNGTTQLPLDGFS